MAAVLALVLASCANPVPPTGGPRDETPPSIRSTRPVQDTVNVSTSRRSVTITFSEYVERSTMTQALSITPQVEDRVRFDWSGRSVTVELPGNLRDSTTYIFTLSTDLTDARGVSLEEPIQFAFSTGPRINQGQLQGTVVGPTDGAPKPKVGVFAYELPDTVRRPPTPLPKRPAYRTQTGEDGTFSFNYLREKRYFVLALKDNNRNQRPDPAEPFAVPPVVSLRADSTETIVPVPWLLTQVDTLGPRVQRAEPQSRQRVQVSFNEPVGIAAPTDRWVVRDSVTGASVPVRAVYESPQRPDAVILRTSPMEEHRHAVPLTSSLVTDTLGQSVRPDTVRFDAVSQPDTTGTYFRSFVPAGLSPDSTGAFPLLPEARPGVRFSQAPDSARLRRVLTLQDTTGRRRSFTLDTADGRTYWVAPDSTLQEGGFLEVAVDGAPLAGPDTTYVRRFRRVTSRMLGELEGRVVLADTTGTTPTVRPDTGATERLGSEGARSNESDSVRTSDRPGENRSRARRSAALALGDSVVVELIPAKTSIPLERRTLTVAPGSTFVFRELPEGSYRFRAFLDRNGNGRWNGGLIQPYTSADPVTWSDQTTDSRPRWTKVLPSALRIPILRTDAPMPTSPAPDTLGGDSTSVGS